jgi:hypothetical protein
MFEGHDKRVVSEWATVSLVLFKGHGFMCCKGVKKKSFPVFHLVEKGPRIQIGVP